MVLHNDEGTTMAATATRKQVEKVLVTLIEGISTRLGDATRAAEHDWCGRATPTGATYTVWSLTTQLATVSSALEVLEYNDVSDVIALTDAYITRNPAKDATDQRYHAVMAALCKIRQGLGLSLVARS